MRHHFCTLMLSLTVSLVGSALVPITTVAQSETCDEAAFARVVDTAGASLRQVTGPTEAELEMRIQKLAELRNWSKAEAAERARAIYQTSEINAIDIEAGNLLLRFDQLSDPGPGVDRCAALAELKRVSQQLEAMSARKGQLMVAALDKALSGSQSTASTPAPSVPTKTAQDNKAPVAKPQAPPVDTRLAAQTPETRATPPAPTSSPNRPGEQPKWETETIQPTPEVLASLPPLQTNETFTAEDIRQAGRGLFGTISAELAAVIEYAVSQYGRPNGYILGTEGGGALLAGLRYGGGKLVLRSGGVSQIYWQGPSLGYDFGVAGSRVMFLVYNVGDRSDVYKRFLGVDGSAFLVGGVGVTFLKKGNIVLAPIRTGLGLRFGANIGYLKFSPKETLNPF